MNNNGNQEAVEIDLIQMLQAILHKWWVIVIAAVVFGCGAFFGTYYLITPEYQASVLMYVNNSSVSLGSANLSISASELTAAQSLVDTYIVILKTRTTLNEVIDYAELEYTYEALRDMIDSAAVNSTEVFEIVVTSTNPFEATGIANAIAIILPDKIADVVDGSSVRIVDYAVTPSERSSPSYAKNTVIGIFMGVVISVLAVVLMEIFDVYVRSEQYLVQTYPEIPILAVIPDINRSAGGDKYYNSKKYGKYYTEAGNNGNDASRKGDK